MNLFADISAGASLLVCSLCDIRARKIPNIILIAAITVSAFAFGLDFLLRLLPVIIGAAFLYYLLLWVTVRLSKRRQNSTQYALIDRQSFSAGNKISCDLGGGDLKLMGLMIAWYEFAGLKMIGVGLAGAAVTGIILIMKGRLRIRDKLPLAPYMLLGFIVCRIGG